MFSLRWASGAYLRLVVLMGPILPWCRRNVVGRESTRLDDASSSSPQWRHRLWRITFCLVENMLSRWSACDESGGAVTSRHLGRRPDGPAQRSGQEARRRRTAESLPRVVVVGDFNGTIDDTALRPLTAQLRSAQEAAGDGVRFSWPAAFPVAGIDQILVKGVTPVSARTLPRTGRDHLPVAAALRL
ncbi:endonuclease/exonuclease/phosphatase family protein [Streptomyces sp. NPDC059863]|uniref:endonuclease/exonuclease/phosphatase family protein n=1 Tax=unclassified Streptomyces TaxID=2593676 RepID=UPI003657ACB8